jgi:2-dehydro-3-deoxygluconokinase
MLRLSPPARLRLEQARTLEVWPAGAELNTAIGLARLGADSAWFSRVPEGPLGEIVLAHARSFGVDVSGLLRAEGRLGLYFSEATEPPLSGQAIYDRAGSAFATLDPAELDWETLLDGASAFHVTGIAAAVSENAAAAVADGLAAARSKGSRTFYDLNLRGRLAPPERWRANLEAVAADVETLVCSAEDARAVFGVEGDPPEVASTLRDMLGVERAVVSRRVAEGAWLRREAASCDGAGKTEATSPAFRATEPIGAGDAFCAGLVFGLLGDGIERGLELGGAMAAIKQGIPGDAPVIEPEELDLALAGDPRIRR